MMTVPNFVKAKSEGRKLTMLTAYDFTWAGLFDAAGVDSVDSVTSLNRGSYWV